MADRFTRRQFLAASSLTLLNWREAGAAPADARPLVNDVHSHLNPTRVERIVRPESLAALQQAVGTARSEKKAVCIAGGRHAMGGQQFAADSVLIDVRGLNRILHLDAERGIVEVEAGIQWPELVAGLLRMQGNESRWGIAQKQTGADRLTLAGTLAANGHGRGLRMAPFSSDVESFVLVGADGEPHKCSRSENAELFRLVCGGYGLFGVVTSLELRLVPRRKVRRVVEVFEVDRLMPAFEKRIADGFLYGDFQFSVEESSEEFLRKGVFSCYVPVSQDTPVPESQKELSDEAWHELFFLAHADKSRAFNQYAEHYLSTSGQVYWSDTHQMSFYPDGYHPPLDRRMGQRGPASEIITEIYVPRLELPDFLAEARSDFRKHQVNVIYGTVRLIEADVDSFIPWARRPWACTIFNLHTAHSKQGIARSAEAFRRLIDIAIRRGGSYFLTYHRYATRRQVEACYPTFVEFLRQKRKHDPSELFLSDWYRHYRRMFRDAL